MRLERYLQEEYAEGLKFGSTIWDVYVNPTPAEVKELKAPFGYRFLIDVSHKKVYIWDASMTHSDMMSKTELAQLRDFSFFKYYREGKAADRIFTGHTNDKMIPFKTIYSDTFLGEDNDGVSDFGNAAYENGESILKSLTALRKKDLSFVKKWMDPKDIYTIIDGSIAMVEKGMNSSAEDDDAAE